MSRVENEEVNACRDKSACSVNAVPGSADSRAADKSAASILCGVGVLGSLLYILNGDKSLKNVILINERKLLYPTTLTFEVLLNFPSYKLAFNESTAMADLKEFEEEKQCSMNDLEVYTVLFKLNR